MSLFFKKRSKSIYRTVFLGVVAILAMMYALVGILEIPLDQAMSLLLASVLIVAGLALLGLLVAGFLALIRRVNKK